MRRNSLQSFARSSVCTLLRSDLKEPARRIETHFLIIQLSEMPSDLCACHDILPLPQQCQSSAMSCLPLSSISLSHALEPMVYRSCAQARLGRHRSSVHCGRASRSAARKLTVGTARMRPIQLLKMVLEIKGTSWNIHLLVIQLRSTNEIEGLKMSKKFRFQEVISFGQKEKRIISSPIVRPCTCTHGAS